MTDNIGPADGMPAGVLFEPALIKALLIGKKAKVTAASTVCADAAYRKRQRGVAAAGRRADMLPAGGAHWVDTDGNGDYSDETTPLTSTTVDDVWSAGYVGLYRAASTSGALQQYDDVRIGCDNTFHKGDLVKGRAATGTSRTPADGIDANIDRTGERCGRCGVAVWAHGLVPNPVHGIVVPESGEGLVRANSAARSAMLSACRDIYFE